MVRINLCTSAFLWCFSIALVPLAVGGCGGGSSGAPTLPLASGDEPSDPTPVSQPGTGDDDPSSEAPASPLLPPVPLDPFPPDGPDSAFYLGASTAVLQGPSIGDGSESNAAQRRRLPVEVEFANEGLALREAVLLRIDNERAGSVVFVLENTSSRTLCEVDLEEIELFRVRSDGTESDGQRYRASVLGLNSIDPSEPSVGRARRCVAPNSLVYALGSRTPATDFRGTISRITIGRLSHGRVAYEIERNPIEPVAYALRAVGANDVELELTLANRSAETARLGPVIVALLDEAGGVVRLTSTFPRWDRSDFMDPGEEDVLVLEEIADYRGRISTIRFVLGADGSI